MRPPHVPDRRLSLVTLDALPPESAADFVRNALQMLVAHEAEHPAVWEFSPQLRRVESLLFKSLFMLDAETT